MTDESLQMFEYANRERLVYSRKVVEKLCQRPAMFKVVDQRSHRDTASHEDGCASENLWI
jgi:hypothetical protein